MATLANLAWTQGMFKWKCKPPAASIVPMVNLLSSIINLYFTQPVFSGPMGPPGAQGRPGPRGMRGANGGAGMPGRVR